MDRASTWSILWRSQWPQEGFKQALRRNSPHHPSNRLATALSSHRAGHEFPSSKLWEMRRRRNYHMDIWDRGGAIWTLQQNEGRALCNPQPYAEW